MPAYKAASYIEKTLESIGIQTYSNWELVVVEDGTDDGTKIIIDKFNSEVEQDVIYFKNDVNKGVSATRNIAATLANGYWLAFLDSDDIWHKDHLSVLMETALNYLEHEVFYSTHTKFHNDVDKELLLKSIDNDKLKDPPFLSKNLPTALFNGYMVQPSTMMLTSKLFHSVNGFNENLRYVEDFHLFFKILVKGYKFIYTRKNTSYYKVNPGGLSSNSIQINYATAVVRQEILDLGWRDVDKKIMLNKTHEAWLLTARLARLGDKKIAKEAIKKALNIKVNMETLFFLVLIYCAKTKQ